MNDFTKRSLLAFIENAIAKGRMNKNTGGGVRAACNKILEQVASEDDVRGVDVKAAILQYNNRHPGELSGDSLRVYESRVRGAIEGFVQSVQDPTGFKFPNKTNGSSTKRSKPAPAAKVNAVAQESDAVSSAQGGAANAAAAQQAGAATDISLRLPFPLRPTFLAHVVIPRDLTKDEAKRLALFIDALAHDVPK
jgi:hypothetical protein